MMNKSADRSTDPFPLSKELSPSIGQINSEVLNIGRRSRIIELVESALNKFICST